MSWDIFISKTPVEQLSDAEFESLGTKDEVKQKLNDILPQINYEDEQWGTYQDDECSIEFNLGDEDESNHLMLHVRGGGDRPIMIIKEICEVFDGYAMDGSSGEQMSFDEADQKSFEDWQNYRNKIRQSDS